MTLHFIPGIGGTADMFRDYPFPFPARAHDYPRPPSSECSFADYARFMIATQGIAAGDVLVGMSLGGMMACEIAKHLPIRKLVLVSSGTQAQHIAPWLRRLSPLSPHVPFRWLQRLTVPVGLFGEVRQRTLRMFKASDPDFLVWGCLNAPRWDGVQGQPDLTQIHGAWDPVFPPRLQRGRLHHVLPRAGHIMLLRQHREIRALLLRELTPLFEHGDGGSLCGNAHPG